MALGGQSPLRGPSVGWMLAAASHRRHLGSNQGRRIRSIDRPQATGASNGMKNKGMRWMRPALDIRRCPHTARPPPSKHDGRPRASESSQGERWNDILLAAHWSLPATDDFTLAPPATARRSRKSNERPAGPRRSIDRTTTHRWRRPAAPSIESAAGIKGSSIPVESDGLGLLMR